MTLHIIQVLRQKLDSFPLKKKEHNLQYCIFHDNVSTTQQQNDNFLQKVTSKLRNSNQVQRTLTNT